MSQSIPPTKEMFWCQPSTYKPQYDVYAKQYSKRIEDWLVLIYHAAYFNNDCWFRFNILKHPELSVIQSMLEMEIYAATTVNNMKQLVDQALIRYEELRAFEWVNGVRRLVQDFVKTASLQFFCDGCGTEIHRDENATKNILDRFLNKSCEQQMWNH